MLFAVTRSRTENVRTRRMELDSVAVKRYLLYRPRLAARQHHRILRGRKDHPRPQFHVVRLSADPLHVSFRDVGNIDSRIVPNGKRIPFHVNVLRGLPHFTFHPDQFRFG